MGKDQMLAFLLNLDILLEVENLMYESERDAHWPAGHWHWQAQVNLACHAAIGNFDTAA
jgi:hypothetical protein